MSSDLVTIDINNGIADVRLNREEKYNALSQDMFDAIIDAGQSLANADDVSAVVLSGNGRGFCAGLDMASFASMSDGSRQSQSGTASLLKKDERPENRAQRPALVWKQRRLLSEISFTSMSKQRLHSPMLLAVSDECGYRFWKSCLQSSPSSPRRTR